jgi:hypothetical protein
MGIWAGEPEQDKTPFACPSCHLGGLFSGCHAIVGESRMWRKVDAVLDKVLLPRPGRQMGLRRTIPTLTCSYRTLPYVDYDVMSINASFPRDARIAIRFTSTTAN